MQLVEIMTHDIRVKPTVAQTTSNRLSME